MISVGIPVYNQKKYLKKCIKSLFENFKGEYELIIVDDKSREKIKQELKDQIKKSVPSNVSVIKYLRNSKNRGFPHNANIILDKSKGEIICILNSDTYICPNSFERIIKVMKSSSKIMIAGPSTSSTNSNQEIYEFSKKRDISDEEIIERGGQTGKRFKKETLDLSQRETNSQIQGFCYFLKRKAVSKIGHFDEIYGIGNYEESDFGARADFLGYKAVWVKKAYVHHFGQKSWRPHKIVKYTRLLSKNNKIWLKKIKHLKKGNIKEVKRIKPLYKEKILYKK